jgi:vacuolar-type H+-ATPase subunit I/STV1
MFEPVRMLKINILVHEKYLEQVTEELGAAGAIHLGNAAAQSRDRLLHSVDCEEDINALQGLYSRCRELMVGLGLPEAAAAESGAAANTSVAEMNDIVAAAEAEFRTEDEAINTLIAESGTLVRDIDRLERYPFRRVRLGDLRDLNHFYIATGRLHPASLVPLAQALGEKALVLHQKDQRSSEEHVLVAASRKSRWAVESELGKFGFVEETPLTDQAETVEAQQQLSAQQLTQVREATGWQIP